MAKKKVSKTAAIREAMKKSQSPSEVAAILKKQGIHVTAQYVSTIKAADKRRAMSGLPKRKPGRPAGSGSKQLAKKNGDIASTSSLLGEAIDLVIAAGGEAEAKQLIATAAKLVAKVRG